MRVTHCDVFEGSKRSVCGCIGAEVAVKQRQLSSRVEGDRKEDSYVLFLQKTLCLVLGDALQGGLRDPSEANRVNAALFFHPLYRQL